MFYMGKNLGDMWFNILNMKILPFVFEYLNSFFKT